MTIDEIKTKANLIEFISSDWDGKHNSIVSAVEHLDEEQDIDNDSDFVLTFQKEIRKRYLKGETPDYYTPVFKDHDVKEPTFKQDPTRNINNWTIRHYSKEKYDIILSMMSLVRKGTIQKGHTNESDWLRIGNVGNTFFILCYNGKPLFDNGGFLNDSHYYFEMPLADVDKMWISTDLLSLGDNRPTEIICGSGESVFKQFFAKAGGLSNQFCESLKKIFNGKIEVKIPHAVYSPSDKWIPITKNNLVTNNYGN